MRVTVSSSLSTIAPSSSVNGWARCGVRRVAHWRTVLVTTRRFQILALDGGGYKAMISAAVLARLEEDLRMSILDHFDLVAGTSTGGIIAWPWVPGRRRGR